MPVERTGQFRSDRFPGHRVVFHPDHGGEPILTHLPPQGGDLGGELADATAHPAPAGDSDDPPHPAFYQPLTASSATHRGSLPHCSHGYQGGGAAHRRTALHSPAVRACGVGTDPERRRESARPPHRPVAALDHRPPHRGRTAHMQPLRSPGGGRSPHVVGGDRRSGVSSLNPGPPSTRVMTAQTVPAPLGCLPVACSLP